MVQSFLQKTIARSAGGLLAVCLLLAANASYAAEEFNFDKGGYVLHGYDPVAYHTENRAVEGRDAYVAVHEGARYRFSSAENMTAFKADPAKYEPAYGGWCSYGVRVGKKFDIDPTAFKVIDSRLYVQLDQGTQKIWLKDEGKNIAIADRLWPSLKPVTREVLGD